MSALDHGVLNVPLAKRGRSLDAQIDDWKASERREAKAQRKAAHERRVAEAAAEADRPKFTAEDVRGARIIRDEFGWHRVVRVNAKSVTVSTAYSWDDRIPLAKVLEVRA